ncbi:MAG: hypothetical protein KGH54_04350 [Candidatus Micrarchaeota archaeon]|nr:hypothetical protein [Candidatus Micrarchaeota archaeon]
MEDQTEKKKRQLKKTSEVLDAVGRAQAYDTLQTLAGHDHAEGGDFDNIRDMISEEYKTAKKKEEDSQDERT